mgnify:FL=1
MTQPLASRLRKKVPKDDGLRNFFTDMIIFYFSLAHFKPIPVIPLKIEKIGERRLKKTNGKKCKTGTPKVEAANEPATPQGIK